MLESAEQVKDALVDAVVDLAARRYTAMEPAQSEAMLRQYYERVAPQDLEDKDPIDLYASAVRHWQFGHRRLAGETSVRVYNPSVDDDGWASPHTVIDVVTEDMPFIVDSVLALLERQNVRVHVLAHPVAVVERDTSGQIVLLAPAGSDTAGMAESFLHLEVDRASDAGLGALHADVVGVLADVRAAVEDWAPMRAKAIELAVELDSWAQEAAEGNPRFECRVGTDPVEVAALLRWMEAGSFTFVGYSEYDLIDDADEPRIVSRSGTGLGILRGDRQSVRELGKLPPETAALARRPAVLNLTKANSISTIHRSVPLDYVGIKEIDHNGVVTGERRLLGMFTSSVYVGRVEDIPVVRAKVDAVIERAKFRSGSHDRSRLLNALQVFPRDELFQIDIDDLESMALDILDLRDRRRVSLLLRRDDYGRFLSCMVFVPRDRHNTDVRLEIQRVLMEVYDGISCRFSTEISDAPLARLHLVIYTDPTKDPELPDLAAVEDRLNRVIRNWDDELRSALIETHGEDSGIALFGRYSAAFPGSYRHDAIAEAAVNDISRLEALDELGLDVRLHRTLESGSGEMRCTLYRTVDPVTLSEFIPVLHDLGAVVVDERPYVVKVDDEPRRFIYDIGLSFDRDVDSEGRARFRDAVLAVSRGEAESDTLAKLVIEAGLSWRQVTVLRAYARYLLQIGNGFSPAYVRETVNQNPVIAAQLLAVFTAKFDPEAGDADAAALRDEVLASIDDVTSLDADRILRSFVALVDATIRTNFFQSVDGAHRPALALKLDPGAVPGIPKPIPLAEIFVHSPRTEGVHLRSGRVARGGIRWSDRMEDFRTEILGLMKAQSVKNSVIVPVGAKGGFIAKRLPVGGDRDEVMAEVIDCYKTFIGAMLDVTDNLVANEIVPPDDVVRLDIDDPYLVVAADKGTATFSDTANAIAESRGFWLGDAFASGGSAGYDHKALAITARGAWVSVERHFAEVGIDVSTDAITAVGIGDMSGDVFGNGMLRSRALRLVAAFDHRDIFIDPDPDPVSGFAERERLFAVPRSSWQDYDTSLISPGGGVFSRSRKSIDITSDMAACLGIEPEITTMTPTDLISAILRAPVDLVWNGGIGTYVKATSEQDSDVGDRGNDAVRVDASELRCRAFAEGGNLGITQLGRIEFAHRGGFINTDAIDNSAGVDCSDHEVNLKILLSQAVEDGDLTRKQRDELLAEMADEVCCHVLANNAAQNDALTAAMADSAGMVEVHQRLMAWLELRVGLDRQLEALPTDIELFARRQEGEGLCRPELAVLMAYTKNLLTADLVASDLADDDHFDQRLLEYFPSPSRERYSELIRRHPLRRELLCTLVSNDIVNHGGVSMVHRLMEETSATVADIARAHAAAWQMFGLGQLLSSVLGLGADVPAAVRTSLHLEIVRLGERAARWLLRNEAQPLDVGATVGRFEAPIRALYEMISAAEEGNDELIDHQIEAEDLVAGGVPESLAKQTASLDTAFGFLDLSSVADRTGAPLATVAGIYALLDNEFDLSWLRQRIMDLPRDDHWRTLARSALRDEFYREHAQLTSVVISADRPGEEFAPEKIVADWLATNTVATEWCRQTLSDIRSEGTFDLARVSVALRALSQLTRT